MELLTTCSDVFGFRFPYYDDSANLWYHFPYVDTINFLSSLHTVLRLIQNKKLWPSSYRYRCQCATKAACQFILWTNDPAIVFIQFYLIFFSVSAKLTFVVIKIWHTLFEFRLLFVVDTSITSNDWANMLFFVNIERNLFWQTFPCSFHCNLNPLELNCWFYCFSRIISTKANVQL